MPKTLDELHHAYVCTFSVHALCDELEKRGVPRVGCPDVYIYECQEFRIDDARALRERALMRPIELSRRVFIVNAASISSEAQNALLKTIEEPRGNAVFFFLIPSPARLLPTFRSRTQQIGHPTSNIGRRMSNVSNVVAQHSASGGREISVPDFLKAPISKRISMLEVYTKKKDDEERDLTGVITFLDALECALSAKKEGLRAVYSAKRFITDKGASIKHLLEHVALLV